LPNLHDVRKIRMTCEASSSRLNRLQFSMYLSKGWICTLKNLQRDRELLECCSSILDVFGSVSASSVNYASQSYRTRPSRGSRVHLDISRPGGQSDFAVVGDAGRRFFLRADSLKLTESVIGWRDLTSFPSHGFLGCRQGISLLHNKAPRIVICILLSAPLHWSERTVLHPTLLSKRRFDKPLGLCSASSICTVGMYVTRTTQVAWKALSAGSL
jgi:hypothetical protein